MGRMGACVSALLLWVGGCGDDGASGGGSGTTSSTVQTTSTIQTVAHASSSRAATTTSSVSGTGGAGGEGGGGGGTQCERVCEKLEEECLVGDVCGDPAQGSVIGCDPPNLSSCTLGCFETHECTEIQTFLATQEGPSMRACLGQCDNALLCKTCIVDDQAPGNCATELGVCGADPVCNGWIGCVNNCSDPACFEACDQAHPGGAPLAALHACICDASRCGEWCGDTLTCPP